MSIPAEIKALNDYIKQLEAAVEAQKEVTEKNIRRFFIPTIGTTIKILQDTPVTIWVEHRNLKLLEKIVPGYQHGRLCWSRNKFEDIPQSIKYIVENNGGYTQYTYYTNWVIPKDTILSVGRVYIRSGKDMNKFDSITFRIEKRKGSKLTGRFWLKRADVNNLVVEIVKEDPR